MCSHIVTYSQCRIISCYTCGFINAGATYLCRATLGHIVTPGTYEFFCLVEFIYADAVYYNRLTNRAALLCRTLHRVAGMCSSTLSDTANRLRKTRKSNPTAVLLFGAVAGLWSASGYPREKGRFTRGWKTAGCLPSCAPARRQRSSVRLAGEIPSKKKISKN